MYSGTCIIQHTCIGGMKNSAGLAGCWIIEVSLYGEISGRCQRILTGLGECWFIEVLDYAGSTVFACKTHACMHCHIMHMHVI